MKSKYLYSIIGILAILVIVLLIVNYPKKNVPENNSVLNDTETNDRQFSINNSIDEIVVKDTQTTSLSNQAVCDTSGYTETAESKVVSEQSPALITGFEKRCDGNYYFTFDYLGPGYGTMNDIENGNGSYYTNTNPKLRTFKVDPNLKVKLTNNDIDMPIASYIDTFHKFNNTIFNQSNAYISNADAGIFVFNITITNGIVTSLNEAYLP